METKAVLVKDRCTSIPVLLLRISKEDTRMIEPLRSAGYDGDYILYQPLDGEFKNRVSYDAYSWHDRTHHEAHLWLEHQIWEEIPDIVDVEVILGETVINGIDMRDLKNKLMGFLKANDLDTDVCFYTPAEWNARGESVGDGSLATLTFEGPLYSVLSLNNGVEYFDEIDQGLKTVLDEFGLYYECGYAWSMHFYRKD
jgi:hypothetical protein